MLLLIGSHAKTNIKMGRGPGSYWEKGHDIDLIGSFSDTQYFIKSLPNKKQCYPIDGGKKFIVKTTQNIFEIEIAWEGSSGAMAIDMFDNENSRVINLPEAGQCMLPPYDFLYTIKMSHRFLRNSPFFLKTMNDILEMRTMGAKIRDEYQNFYKLRMKETYWYNHPNLNVNKDTFFSDDGVNYLYDHDTIHEAVAISYQPAYKFYQPEENEVNTSKEMFFFCSREIQLNGVLEEAYVLALERSQIPHGDRMTPKQSFDMALMKICTSITSGWFRTFAWEHYYAVQALYSDDYVAKFKKALDKGMIKPYTTSTQQTY